MRKISKGLALMLAFVLLFSFTACGTSSKEYTITFNTMAEDASSLDSITYTTGDTSIVYEVPTREGYTFTGWYNNENLSGNVTFAHDSSYASDMTLYASWAIATYNIDYKISSRNGEELPFGTIETYTMFDEQDYVLPTPTKPNYSFVGWYDNPEREGDKITVIEKGSTGDKEFYPLWSGDTVSLVLELNGGVGSSSVNYQYGTEYIFETPTRTDYTFVGWYDTSDFNGDIYTKLSDDYSGSVYFYAKWKGESYNITYNLYNGKNELNPSYHEYGIETILYSAEKTGYTFVGWYDNASFSSDAITSIPAQTREAITLYAMYEEVDTTITYNTNGGKMPCGYAQGFNSSEGLAVLSVPTKDGYEFEGWYSDSDCTNKVTSISAGSSSIELFAGWTVKTYTITFETNLDEGKVSSITYTIEDSAITLSKPTLSGYVFSGWYTDAGCTSSTVSKLDAGSYGDKTYYGKYEVATYTLTFNLVGGSYNGYTSYEQDFTIDSDIDTAQITPTRTGYIFGGWYTNQNYSVEVLSSQGYYKDTTIYAKWTNEVYAISYNVDGGTMPSSYITEYTFVEDSDEIGINNAKYFLPQPTKSGYTFGGWYESSDLSGDVVSTIFANETGAKTYYAKWITGSASSSTVRMEAEETNLNGVSGPGYSGSATGSARIKNDAETANASGGKGITYTHGTGVFVAYEFELDRTVSDAVITICLGSEIGEVTFTSNEIQVIVNGVVYDNWSGSIYCSNNGMYATATISGVTLSAGYNIIELNVLDNELGGSGVIRGPVYDYIEVTANATIDFDPITY